MSINRSNVESFAIGVGSYFAATWMFTFYPAFIVALQVYQSMRDGHPTEPWEKFACIGFVVMVVGWLVILVLTLLKQYLITVIIYILTLWPMIHQFICYYNNLGDQYGVHTCFPLPAVDWCIFF